MIKRLSEVLIFFLIPFADSFGCFLPDNRNGKEFQDTLQGKQFIYNGRIWRNPYSRIRGDAYFLTGDFINGRVHFNDKVYDNLKLKYDTHSDEVILFVNPLTIIILNKELTDRFILEYEGKEYCIINLGMDTAVTVNGYINLLYEGKVSFYVKYIKKIEPLAEEKIFDRFYGTHRMYLKRDSLFLPFFTKRGILRIMEDREPEVKDFIKIQKLILSGKDPYSFIPLIRFYDSLQRTKPVLK